MRLVLIVSIWLMLLATVACLQGRVMGDPLPGCHFNTQSPTIAPPC